MARTISLTPERTRKLALVAAAYGYRSQAEVIDAAVDEYFDACAEEIPFLATVVKAINRIDRNLVKQAAKAG
jgi:hypothetical protein